jgi:hypothetical protein
MVFPTKATVNQPVLLLEDEINIAGHCAKSDRLSNLQTFDVLDTQALHVCPYHVLNGSIRAQNQHLVVQSV